MTTLQKSVLAIVGIVVLVGSYGGYRYLFSSPSQIAGTSPTGSTFGTAKYAGITANLAAPGANATSSSILNTDSNDRYPTAVRIGCQGIGTSKVAYSGGALANLLLSVGTSSTAAPTQVPGTLVTGSTITIGTTTGQDVVNTVVTASVLGAAVWPAGSYMTFFTNATNTAQCTFGVDYIGS